jgi:hypothetical protein
MLPELDTGVPVLDMMIDAFVAAAAPPQRPVAATSISAELRQNCLFMLYLLKNPRMREPNRP